MNSTMKCMHAHTSRCRRLCKIFYLAALVNKREREREWAHLAELIAHFSQTLPQQEDKHLHLALGELRTKIECHQ